VSGEDSGNQIGGAGQIFLACDEGDGSGVTEFLDEAAGLFVPAAVNGRGRRAIRSGARRILRVDYFRGDTEGFGQLLPGVYTRGKTVSKDRSCRFRHISKKPENECSFI